MSKAGSKKRKTRIDKNVPRNYPGTDKKIPKKLRRGIIKKKRKIK